MSKHEHANDRVDDIERDIDRDRDHLSQTIRALEDRLSPGQIFDQVWGYARRNGGTFSDNLVRTISENPVPVILTAAGIAWMALARHRDRDDAWYSEDADYPVRASYGVDPSYDDAYDDDIDQLYGDTAYLDTEFGSTATTTSSPAASATSKAGQKYRDVKDTLESKTREAKEGARHLTRDARRSARHLRDRSRRQWSQASHGARDFFDTNPLAVGAAALALGALIGAALPETEAERRLLGEKGERLTGKAKSLVESSVNDLTEAGKAGAHAIKENLKSSSSLQGRA